MVEQQTNRIRRIDFPRSSRNEREYEIFRSLKRDGRGHLLEKKVRTSSTEIARMAHVVDAADADAETFLQLLKHDAAAFGISPDQVYDDEYPIDGKWGYRYTLDETESLRDICCTAAEYGASHREDLDVEDAETVVERLGELCDLLEVATDIEIAPELRQN